jgi:hypothetical protein
MIVLVKPHKVTYLVQRNSYFIFAAFFLLIMSGSVLLHHQLSSQHLQQLLVWYKIRYALFGENCIQQDLKKGLELASVCEHPYAVWLTRLFAGRDIGS